MVLWDLKHLQDNVFYDPNDVARTTIKETNIDNNRTANVSSSDLNKSIVYNPNDIMPRITMKQTTVVKNVMGHYNKQDRSTGYLLKKVNVPETNRQNCSVDYTGNAENQRGDGYKVANAIPRNTKRQFISDNDYTGNAGGKVKPMSYSDVYNATINTLKGDMIHNRLPGAEGNKVNARISNANVITHREVDRNNFQLNNRGVQPTRIHNSIPQNIICR